jgi:hypothetical protein
MCQRVDCSACGKPTYVGCGRHVEAVLGDVPRGERCECRAAARAAEAPGSGREKSWMSGWLERTRRRP